MQFFGVTVAVCRVYSFQFRLRCIMLKRLNEFQLISCELINVFRWNSIHDTITVHLRVAITTYGCDSFELLLKSSLLKVLNKFLVASHRRII
jgi:hypothetical protein